MRRLLRLRSACRLVRPADNPRAPCCQPHAGCASCFCVVVSHVSHVSHGVGATATFSHILRTQLLTIISSHVRVWCAVMKRVWGLVGCHVLTVCGFPLG